MAVVATREIGIPVRSVNRAGLYPSRDRAGSPRIIGTMSQQAAGFFLLEIDPVSGAFRQLQCPDEAANYTTAVHVSRSGRVYIGAAHTGGLWCFDPGSDSLLDLGVINGEAAIFPCRIDEDSRGLIWISSYGTADLTSYDPERREFTRHGRLDEVDMYAYCYVNSDDTVASLIMMTRPHVVVLDPSTGERRNVGPVVTKGVGTLALIRGVDGGLYIESSEGNFRVEGMTAVPVDTVPVAEEAPSTFPDGTSFRYADAKQFVNRELEILSPDGTRRSFHLDYEAAGTDIFCVHGGPDGLVYGSSVLPEHFFRYDPETGEMTDFGICSEAAGEAYSMANLDGKIYISSYPGARLSVYDPAKPYRFGVEPGSNPRDLGRPDEISYRPRSTLAGPDGKVWLASVPDYGLWGGPLASYDPATERMESFLEICGSASCYTLAWLEELELIAVGTTIQGGSGTTPKATKATLMLFDYREKRVVWEGRPEGSEPVKAFTTLVATSGSRIVGVINRTGGERLFAFDARARRFEIERPAPAGGMVDNGIVRRPDGALFAMSRSRICRIDAKSLESECVHAFDPPIASHASLGPIVEGDLYYSIGRRLYAAEIGR